MDNKLPAKTAKIASRENLYVYGIMRLLKRCPLSDREVSLYHIITSVCVHIRTCN